MKRGIKSWCAGLVAMATLGVVSVAFAAGQVSSTRINSVNVNVDGQVLIAFDTATTGKPNCALDGERMVFAATTDGGKALLNAVMGAYLGGKSVTLTGTGTCLTSTSNGSQFERLAHMYFY